MLLASLWSAVAFLPAVIEGTIGSRSLDTLNTLKDRDDRRGCCSAVQQVLPDKILRPNQFFRFRSQQQSYWDNQQRDVSPACFVLPTSAQEVSAVLVALVNNQCQFAIRSGGHSPIKGWSNIEGGVTLDLSNFKGVDLAPDKSYVSVKPGTRWADVYSQLSEQNLGTSGGRVATVGVGGLVTGGGISYFSRERGLVCDNVIEFETVLTNGSIVLANQKTNSDLYKALKGGTGNFGIVTNIKLTTFRFDGGRMWGGTVFHKTEDSVRRKLFDHFVAYSTSGADAKAHWIYSWSRVNAVAAKIWASTSNIQYSSPSRDTPEIFRPVVASDVTLFSTAKSSTLNDQAKDMANLNQGGSRQLFATFCFKNSAAFMEEFFQLSSQHVRAIEHILGLQFTISYQSLPYSTYSQSAVLGGNSLGLDDDTDDLIVALLTATWKFGWDDEAIYATSQALFTEAKQRSDAQGLGHSFLYLNYADKWQDPIAGYGPAAVAHLRAVSQAYDPQGVFSNLVPGGFKIPAA